MNQFHLKIPYMLIASILLLTIGYAAAQSSQGHPWTEIILPTSPNVWTGLNAEMLDGMHYSDFSARLWSGYDPNTDNIWYNDGGNVGIGTTNPSQKLDVSGNIRASGSLTGSQVCIGTDCINSWSDVRDTDWTESGGNVYRASGNVGIGTTTPSQKLDVSGNIKASGSLTGSQVCIGTDCINSWSDVRDTDWTESGGNVYRASGNVGIGTASPSYKLDVSGTIRATGDVRGNRLCIGSSCRSSWPSSGGGNHIQVFTSSGTFTVPEGVTRVKVTLIGGGGGGSGCCYHNGNYFSGGGGGAGGFVTSYVSVAPGQNIAVTIGNGGNGGSHARNGNSGSRTSFGTLAYADGGRGGNYYYGNGGAGGGGSGMRVVYGSRGSEGGFDCDDDVVMCWPSIGGNGGNSNGWGTGGAGGNHIHHSGYNGQGYGSGGGGTYCREPYGVGGKGAPGLAIVEW